MADVAQGRACILYAKLGSLYYPIACSTSVNISIEREVIELAPRSSADAREYEYGRYTGEITGSGLTAVNTAPDNLYTVFDLAGFQLSKQKLLVKFSINDSAGNYKVFECNTIIRTVGLSKESASLGRHDYALQITGPVTISATPVENTNPQILTYEYDAAGGEDELTMTWGDNATILVLYVNGVQTRVYDAPTGYGPGEAQYDGATKIISFGTALTAGDYVKVIYIDVDSVNPYTLEDGNGNYIEDGNGNLIDTQ